MRRADADAAFVLVEALAALVVTAIAAAGLLAALSSARDRAEEARVRDLALRQARHLLAEATGGDLAGLDEAGEVEDSRLTWRRAISPLPEQQSVVSIVVEVDWTARRRMGTTRLETYRFITP